MEQLVWLEPRRTTPPTPTVIQRVRVGVTSDLLALLRYGDDVLVALNLSGGKDSRVMALEVDAFLNEIDFTGRRLCIHADLDDDAFPIEWAEAQRSCREIASLLGCEFLVVRRAGGGMITRWHQRWQANVARYQSLACVKLIMPWSSAGMRFCTSEQKAAPIAQELTRRYPNTTIINVVGIRADESSRRAKAAIFAPADRLTKPTRQTTGYTWNAIRDMRRPDVDAVHAAHGLQLPAVYTDYGLSRLSCMFCVLASQGDLARAAATSEALPAYRAITRLEIQSTFSFQDKRWLADLAPHLLDPDVAAARDMSKQRAATRQALEADIPPHLLFTKQGWPQTVPTGVEAALLAHVRRQMGTLMHIAVQYTTPEEIIAHYTARMGARPTRDVTPATPLAAPPADPDAGDQLCFVW